MGLDVAGPEDFNVMECFRACENRISLKELLESPSPQLFNVSKPRITQSRVQGDGHQRYSDPHNIENQGRVFVIVSHRPGGPPEEGAARGTPWGPNYIVTPPIWGVLQCPDSCVSNLQARESSASADFEYFDPLFSFGATCSTEKFI